MTHTETRYEWRTSRGQTALSFNDEEKARIWKERQVARWEDKLPETNLFRVVVETKVEALQ